MQQSMAYGWNMSTQLFVRFMNGEGTVPTLVSCITLNAWLTLFDTWISWMGNIQWMF